MNPFQRLRQAINNVDLGYKFPEGQNSSHQSNIHSRVQVLPCSSNQKIAKLWDDKQTQYIRQINNLSNKVQALSKNIKLVQIQNQDLLKEITKLQKLNQKMKASIQTLQTQLKASDEREKKYKEQIFRINKSMEQLGIELNQQRNMKNNILAEKNRNQQQMKAFIENLQRNNNQLESKIRILKEQAQQRNKMLQFNFKRNSQQKAQLKREFEKTKLQIINENKNLKNQLENVKKSFYEIKSLLDLEKQKRQSLQAALKKMEKQLGEEKLKTNQVNQQIAKIVIEKNTLQMENQRLRFEIEQINVLLEHEKNNKKVKIVEVRNEALELQLDMYRRQCKELLHQRAVMSSLHTSSKALDHSYRNTLQYE